MIGKTVNKKSRKFQLRTTLVVPFVLQIVAAVGLVGYLSFRNGQKAVDELATQLSSQVSSRVSQQLSNYLATPQQVNGINAQAINLGMLNLQDFNTTGRFFWQQMRLSEKLSYIMFCSQERWFIGIGRENDGSLYTERIQAPDLSHYKRYALDQQGNPTKLLAREAYLPKEDIWYKNTVARGKPTWNPIHQWPDRPEIISISSTYPVYDSSKRLMGVLSIDFILSQISDFLRNLPISSSGKVFIMERDGMIIGSSSQEKSYREVDGKAQRLNVSQSQEPLLRESAQQLRDRFGTFDQISTPQLLSMKLNHERTFVSVTPWQDVGLNWVVVVLIPESDFMGQINANTRNTILLCLVALGLAIAFGLLTTRSITLPIIRITKASEEIAAGNLDKQVDTSGFIEIKEIDTLGHSFNSMAWQLKDYFETLEAKNEELRITEENYRSIFENALEGIFQSSPEGRYINANPALANIYGYDSPTEMIESVIDINEEVYVDPETRIEFQEILEKHGTAKNFEYRSYCKDGSIIWTQIDARVVKDNQGNVLYYEGIVKDISDRKRREHELRRQLEELKIEIDHNKREQEVAMLTESSYFQEVQQEMAEVNLDEFWS